MNRKLATGLAWTAAVAALLALLHLAVHHVDFLAALKRLHGG